MHITQVTGWVHLHVHMCARADVPLFGISETARPIALKFGCVVRDPLAWRLKKARVWYICTCTCADLPLGNGWTDCAEILCVVRNPLAERFTKV